MARGAVRARMLRYPPFCIRPNVGRLHASITVLTIGDCVTDQPFHERHFAEQAAGILDEPPLRLANLDDSEGLLCECDGKAGAVTFWNVPATTESPVFSDRRNAKPLAGRRGPENIDAKGNELSWHC